MREKKKLYVWVVAVALALAVIGAVGAFRGLSKNQRVMVSVSGYSLPAQAEVTIGDGSAVCFNSVPHDYLLVKSIDGGYVWRVNPQYAQSNTLRYLKVNSGNPNRHDLQKDDCLVIHSTADSLKQPVSISRYQIDTLLREMDKADRKTDQYVQVRHLLARMQKGNPDFCPKADFKHSEEIRSIIYRKNKKSDWSVVILDTCVRAKVGTEMKEFRYFDTVRGDCCKVQFYKVDSYSMQTKELDKEVFRIDSVNYVSKPSVEGTEWGAGHVMLRKAGSRLQVSFPKPVTYVERIDVLLGKEGNRHITLHQMDGSFPLAQNVFLPQFSSAVRQDVCSIERRNDTLLCGAEPLKTNLGLKSLFVPTYQTISNVEKSHIDLQARLMNGHFYVSFFLMPLLVALLLMVLFRFAMSTDGNHSSNLSEAAKRMGGYSMVIFLIAFLYMTCKQFISIKLAYTYPYFDKMVGISTSTTCLMLLLIYNLSQTLNSGFLKQGDKQTLRKWLCWGGGVVVFVILWLVQGHLNGNIMGTVLSSYLPEETKIGFNIFKWNDNDVMLDLHRAVPYTLLAANGLALTVRFFLLLLGVPKFPSVRLTGLGVVLLGVICICLAAKLSGNFSTFLITLLVVFTITAAVGHIPILPENSPKAEKKKKVKMSMWKTFGVMLLTVGIVGVSAIIMGDTGYLTNVIGFFIFVVIVWYISVRVGEVNHVTEDVDSKMRRRPIIITTAVVLALVFLLSIFVKPEAIDYRRRTRRLLMFSRFDDYSASGYKYAMSDTEFNVVMSHYIFNLDGSDPLSTQHMLHSSVSTGQSPVVLNDLSLPAAFIGAYGIWAYLLYFGLLVALFIWVVSSFVGQVDAGSRETGTRRYAKQSLWRLLAVCMWFGTTVYLFLSYVNVLPFTGRLNPGFGVDSVGEAIETVILMAFMLSASVENQTSTKSAITT